MNRFKVRRQILFFVIKEKAFPYHNITNLISTYDFTHANSMLLLARWGQYMAIHVQRQRLDK